QLREDVLETNQGRRFHFQVAQLKRRRAFSWSKAAWNRREKFHERKPAGQWHIFSEDNQVPLSVTVREAAIRADQKAAVVKLTRLAVGSNGHVIGPDHEPDMMVAGQTGDGIKSGLFVSEQFGDACFGPKQKVCLIRQRLFRELDQIPEPLLIFTRVPDQSLRNARLNERNSECASRWL